MGIGGISIWQLLIILAIIVVLFGTKKLRNIGSDLGSGLRNFKKAMKEGESDDKDLLEKNEQGDVFENKTETKNNEDTK